MADTVRTLSTLLGLISDNTNGAISPQDHRDCIVSATGYEYHRAVSTSQALTADDRVIVATGGAGGITLTLPAVATVAHKVYTVVKVDSGAGAVTLDGNGAETINGAATYDLAAQWNRVKIGCDGTQWIIEGS